MIYVLFALAAAAAAYQAITVAASIAHLVRGRAWRRPPGYTPPVSILKPVRGIEPHFYDCIRSHAVQDYPEFEILFGLTDPDDPAVAEIERLRAEFPGLPIRIVVSATRAANRKVGVLADLAAAARYPVLLVNDADIRVSRDYLARVAAPLEDPRYGMVTCMYRAVSDSLPARFESIGIATDFAPSVLVAPLVGVSEFALGSTMAFRAADLERIGGFQAIGDYLADDYQLSRRIRDLGKRVLISRVVVETCLPDATWSAVWKHQVRWARTIRVSRGDGYIGMPIANATLWAALLGLCGRWRWALALEALRLGAGVFTAAAVLQDRSVLRDWFLMPLRDAWGAAVWVAGLFGKTVEWRGRHLELSPEGKIIESPGRSTPLQVDTSQTNPLD